MTAAPDYTVDGMVSDVRNDYITPQSQNLFLDTDIVKHLDKAMRSKIIPLINSAREDYWVNLFTQPVTGQASYTIPQRSSGAMLVNVVFVDTTNNRIELNRLTTKKISSTFPFGYQLPLYTFGYYVQDDQLFLYPQQAQTATQYNLQMIFLRRPNNLTLVNNCGKILVIAGNILTVDNIDPTWTTSTKFDIIQNFPQFNSIQDGATITNINTMTSQITLTTAPTGISVGMYLCPTLMSCIPQIPYESYDILIAAAAARIARALGDSQGLQLAEKNYEEASSNFIKLIEPRIQESTKKIVNRNNPFNFGIMGTPFLR
jgi:hypothetical protein